MVAGTDTMSESVNQGVTGKQWEPLAANKTASPSGCTGLGSVSVIPTPDLDNRNVSHGARVVNPLPGGSRCIPASTAGGPSSSGWDTGKRTAPTCGPPGPFPST